MSGRAWESRIYLVMTAGAGAVGQFDAARAVTPIAAVLVMPPFDAGRLQDLIAHAQSKGVAVLLADDCALARSLRADGVHLSLALGSETRLLAAREAMGKRSSIGASVGDTRHEAMTLAEAGAEYVAFGLAPAATAPDAPTAAERRAEMVAWWSEIFAIPCVAFDVTTAAEAGELTALGADFIAVSIAADAPAVGIAALITEVAAAIAVNLPVAESAS